MDQGIGHSSAEGTEPTDVVVLKPESKKPRLFEKETSRFFSFYYAFFKVFGIHPVYRKKYISYERMSRNVTKKYTQIYFFVFSNFV